MYRIICMNEKLNHFKIGQQKFFYKLFKQKCELYCMKQITVIGSAQPGIGSLFM